ncbi:ATP-binding protein [Candidatus Poribacteria bacterium]|nr:ATP-binding protein [Candidatus Poribacteria bacterium]
MLDDRFVGLQLIQEAGGTSIYGDLGLSSLLPIEVCGEGFMRLLPIAVELAGAQNKVLLIDEVDNGLHHRVMERFWPFLAKLSAELDVQVFATTHNDEMVQSALDQLNKTDEGVGLYRLELADSGHRVLSYDRTNIEVVLDSGLEVR